MTTEYEIPLDAQAQTFSIVLGTTVYKLTVTWNIPLNCWILNIADTDSNPIIQGIPLVTGVDLLGQYAYLGLGGSLVVQSLGPDPSVVPSYSSLGSSGLLFFVTNP